MDSISIKFFGIIIFCLTYNNTCFSQAYTEQKPIRSKYSIVRVSLTNGINYNYYYFDPVNKNLFNNYFFETEIRLGKQYNPKKVNNGYGVSYARISKNNIIGDPISLFGYFELVNFKNKLLVQISAGGAYFINKKHLFNMPTQNPIIGSKFNLYLAFNSSFRIPISKRINATVGVKLLHYSNGNVRTPNIGVNLLGLSTSLVYKLNDKEFDYFAIKKTNQSLKNTLSISPRFAFITHRDGNKNNQYLITLSVDYWKEFYEINYFNFGWDNFYETSLMTNNKIDLYFFGLHIGYKFQLQSLALITQVGVLLKNRAYSIDRFYTKFGCEFKINSRLRGIVLLKTKSSKGADFIEWGLVRYFHL